MLRAGWNARNLNAPEKFLVSAPEHQTPKRARAYLLTTQVVVDTAARYAGNRPGLDQESQHAIITTGSHRPIRESSSAGNSDSPDAGQPAPAESTTGEKALRIALCMAPEEGAEIGDLMRVTGMTRPTIYRHLREHVKAGSVVQVSRGRWRARITEEPSPLVIVSPVVSSHPRARVCT